MSKKPFSLVSVLLLLAVTVFAGGAKEPSAAKAAPTQPAALAPETEDWEAIAKAAQAEGKVVIYSLSSRIFDAVKTFNAQYPGITVEASDMTGPDQVEKLTREQAAGVYNVDVLNIASGPTVVNELLPKGLLKNYVPQVLVDGKASKDVIPQAFREPALVHSLEAKVVFYNFETYPQPPVDSLWDLTRPEWMGRVQMKDPMSTEENMNLLQTIVQKADLMAAAYKEEFGEDIKLSPGIKNAGYEFILRLVRNKLVLVTSDGTASKAVGTAGQKNPPLTFAVASSKIRDNAGGQKLAIAWNLKPKVGIVKENYLLMANKAPHPNAARLLIRWMLGDAKGGAGMVPWYVEGQWASRSDVPPVGSVGLGDLGKYTWSIDYPYVFKEGLAVRDFWLGL